MDVTATPLEELGAALDCIVEEAIEAGAHSFEIIGLLSVKAQQVGLNTLGFYDDADAEGDEKEEV